MRGKVCYAMVDEAGEVLTWFGRDPAFEEKHARWIAGGRQGEEPRKTNFVKGFQRGLELYGQHQLFECGDEQRELLEQTGLVIVEGPNDVISLAALGQPAVGLCSNTFSDAQVQKLADYAREFAGGKITLMLDADTEGDRGAKEGLWKLAEAGLTTRLAWSRSMHGEKFADRQPESLDAGEWDETAATLRT